MADLQFELVSPERILASQSATMVVVPGAEGDFGVLAEHAPFLSTLRPGLISIYEGDSVTSRIFVEGGFAEVNRSGCIVLAEAAEPFDEITADIAREKLRLAQEALDDLKSDSESERARLEQAVEVARVRVDTVDAA